MTGSGKSTASRHLTTQLLHHAARGQDQRLGDQINFACTILDAFGQAKTPLNQAASHHARYTELHFDLQGRVTGAKFLPFGLQKSRVNRLRPDERSFHVFYQLLAGASPQEVDELQLEEPGAYALLASSGCFRLPGGPFSDDAAQMGELRAAMASCGFKAKHVKAIFTTLTAILVLSNITFLDDDQAGSLGMSSYDRRARIEDPIVLGEAARLLCVEPTELERVLVNRTRWIKNELQSILLDSQGAGEQRDCLMRELYAIMFSFIVEMINRRCAPPDDSPPGLQVVQLELPGFTSRATLEHPKTRTSVYIAPLVDISGHNGLDELATNFLNEMLHSYLVHRAFDNDVAPASILVADGVSLPDVVPTDNGACIELLRGGAVSSTRLLSDPIGLIGCIGQAANELRGERTASDELSGQIRISCRRSPAFSSKSSGQETTSSFTVTHFAGHVTYDATDFVEESEDVMDKQLVDLVANSSNPFIARLVSGPGLACTQHPLDEGIVVEAQVSITPLRQATRIAHPTGGAATTNREALLSSTTPRPALHQVNSTMAYMLNHLNATLMWTVHCIRPNDSGHPNSFDKRRVKAQVQSLLLPDLLKRRQLDLVYDISLDQFCARHNLSSDQRGHALQSFAQSRRWEPSDFRSGRERVWLSWRAWKDQDDLTRAQVQQPAQEKEFLVVATPEVELNPFETPAQALARRTRMETSDSTEQLLPDTQSSYFVITPRDDSPTPGSAIWSEAQEPFAHPGESQTGTPFDKKLDEERSLVVHRRSTKEELPVTHARRWWIRLTWLLTWWIPSFALRLAGKKRPDVRMAWREKVAIFMIASWAPFLRVLANQAGPLHLWPRAVLHHRVRHATLSRREQGVERIRTGSACGNR